jgi:hypothetical protein
VFDPLEVLGYVWLVQVHPPVHRSLCRITWRRLEVQRGSEFDATLEEFVIKNLPKQFHFSLAKLTANESFLMVDEGD